jgi:hypothetical protein
MKLRACLRGRMSERVDHPVQGSPTPPYIVGAGYKEETLEWAKASLSGPQSLHLLLLGSFHLLASTLWT